MKRILSLAVIFGLLISMCGCTKDDDNDENKSVKKSSASASDTDKSSTTKKASSATVSTTKQKEKTTASDEIKYSEKIFSKDKNFSLCYYCSSYNPKSGEPLVVKVKFKNETDKTFKVGLEDITQPVHIVFLAEEVIWGYEGSDLRPNQIIKPNQEIIQTVNLKTNKKGKYNLLIFADFGRELLPGEDKNSTEMNLYNPDLANCSISVDNKTVNIQ